MRKRSHYHELPNRTNAINDCNFLIRLLEGVQLLSDELSEVSDDLKLTVQLLIADFAAVNELSGKNISAEF